MVSNWDIHTLLVGFLNGTATLVKGLTAFYKTLTNINPNDPVSPILLTYPKGIKT